MQKLTRSIRKGSPDLNLFIIVVILVVFGVIFLSSASSVISFQEYNDSRYMFLKQVAAIIIGFIAMGIFYKVDVSYWKKLALPMLAISVITLIAVFIPGIGVEHGGAKRWIDIGPVQIQPSELLKFSMIIYLATLFEKKGREVRDAYGGLVPFVVLVAFMGLLIMAQPDLGTLLVLIAIAGVMYFVSGAKTSHLAYLGLAGVFGIIALIKLSPYRMQRFMVFLSPGDYADQAAGYQINQALIAIGSGGIIGRGFGQSLQKYRYLPEAATDSIFAIIAEERGLIGAVFMFLLFVAFGFFGFKIARSAKDAYTRLLAVGITSWIVFQAVLNICATLSLVPLTGVTLPFISFGGTSVVVVIASCGILLNISRKTLGRSAG
ncbi:putative lipid II flippase FtsW [candidate division WS5 bacterium]|uniref:Probable peptidoglycan glycosyltransferase FtsW n=1 Tax=candidate division WS5 bacterium TaxID=2093353 RepID=A0A419DA21_9BACT|nr:MAG: putative lipid II flippase FtsW [candidate division WS5 bacterium]